MKARRPHREMFSALSSSHRIACIFDCCSNFLCFSCMTPNFILIDRKSAIMQSTCASISQAKMRAEVKRRLASGNAAQDGVAGVELDADAALHLHLLLPSQRRTCTARHQTS